MGIIVFGKCRSDCANNPPPSGPQVCKDECLNKCHGKGNQDEAPAANDLVSEYQQYQQQLGSRRANKEVIPYALLVVN